MSNIVPSTGDTVLLRDGRNVVVTDVADQNLFAYPYSDDGQSVMPAETIFVGTGPSGGTVVSDFSEIVSILN